MSGVFIRSDKKGMVCIDMYIYAAIFDQFRPIHSISYRPAKLEIPGVMAYFC